MINFAHSPGCVNGARNVVFLAAIRVETRVAWKVNGSAAMFCNIIQKSWVPLHHFPVVTAQVLIKAKDGHNLIKFPISPVVCV